ncbi:MAG: hypothetical protein QM755_02575 [Luteolibacter sp.]
MRDIIKFILLLVPFIHPLLLSGCASNADAVVKITYTPPNPANRTVTRVMDSVKATALENGFTQLPDVATSTVDDNAPIFVKHFGESKEFITVAVDGQRHRVVVTKRWGEEETAGLAWTKKQVASILKRNGASNWIIKEEVVHPYKIY